jgi:hypothetical protein
LQIARRTLQRDLQELVDKGYLHLTGATNNLRYYLGTPRSQ